MKKSGISSAVRCIYCGKVKAAGAQVYLSAGCLVFGFFKNYILFKLSFLLLIFFGDCLSALTLGSFSDFLFVFLDI